MFLLKESDNISYIQTMYRTTTLLNYICFLLGSLLMIGLSGCEQSAPRPKLDITQASLIPIPGNVQGTPGSFELLEESRIYAQEGSDEAQKEAEMLASYLRPATGYALPVITEAKEGETGLIRLEKVGDGLLGKEGYRLSVTADQVRIAAYEPEGWFRGIQTLRQLFPPEMLKNSVQQTRWLVPTGEIKDQPRYAYRGAMLDVARHFHDKETVKQLIDYMALYKMNSLHLHLTDDQGWRIEIKGWPNLTATGGKTEVGGGEGGFYTQDDFREIVQYAAERYMMIIPEIDMPGHTEAALVSYPELSCDGKQRELYTGTDVGFSTFCTDKEEVYSFITDVVNELAEISPSPYIHIGGDESHVTPKAGYLKFVSRVQEIVNASGKKMIGWDEIAQVPLDQQTTVQLWHHDELAEKAIEQGCRILMSPASRTYLDMQYDSLSRIGLHWAGYLPVDKNYDWDPATFSDKIGESDIWGIEGPLWSETVEEMADIHYLMFPRLLSIAETGWSAQDRRDWETYRVRLGMHAPYLEAMDIAYYPSEKIEWKTAATE